MRRPRLLFVSTVFLFPADTGGRIRTANILRGMKGGRFEIVLASPAAAGVERHAGELARVADRFVSWPAVRDYPLRRFARLAQLARALPISVATDRLPAGQAAVARELQMPPDLVLVDFAHAAVLLPEAVKPPIVVFTHNVEAEIYERHAERAPDALRRWVWRDQGAKMRLFEGAALRRAGTVIAVSERDREQLARRYGLASVATIPTGVDLDYFSFVRPREPAGETLVFTGSMDWRANIEGIEHFMDAVWPRIVALRPNARFVVVGRNPPADLVARARNRGLAWQFTGFVDDVRPFVRQADAYVIPLRIGSGTRMKAYEAMALGCPVVSTALGMEGLTAEPDRHFLLADDPAAFAQAAIRLLQETDLRQRMAAEARALVAENFGAARVARAFEDICFEAYLSAHELAAG